MKASVVLTSTRTSDIEITADEFAVLAAGRMVCEAPEYLARYNAVYDDVVRRAQGRANGAATGNGQELRISHNGRSLIEEHL